MALIGASNSLGGLAGSNSTARLLVVISGNSSPLSQALAQAEGSLAGFSRNADSIGNALTRSLTLPLLALGAVSVKFASDFQASVARIAGLTPLLDDTGATVGELSDELLKLASNPEIIAGPTDLANALYFAGSAGLDAEKGALASSEAFQVVGLSAKAASIGMGEAADISKVLIFALNNFGDVGLTAATAMDQLVAAIKEGTAEPEEMAIALGRLLPVAKEAGVTFGETVAAVAALSNLGVPTRVATTSLRALFSELLAPTIQATEALHTLGVTSLELRDALARGPIEAFELLLQATNGNVEALHDIIPQIRGFTAFLGLTDQQMRKYERTLDAVENAHGALDDAMSEIVQTPMFKFQKGLQSLQIAAIKFGGSIVPVFNKISQVLQDVGNIVAGLPKPVLDMVAAFVTIGIVIGPAFKLFAALTQVRQATLASNVAATAMVPTFRSMAVGITTVALAAGIAYGGFKSMASGAASLFTIATTGIATFVGLATAMRLLQTAVNAGALGVNALSVALASVSGGTLALVAAGMTAIGLAIAFTVGQSNQMNIAAKQMGEALLEGAQSGKMLKETLEGIKDTGTRERLMEIASAMGILERSTGEVVDALRGGIGDEFSDALEKLQQSGQASESLSRMIDVLQRAAEAGVDAGHALNVAGFSSEEFFGEINKLSQASATGGANVVLLAKQVNALALQYGHSSAAVRQFNREQQASIITSVANEQGIERLADKYGVSVDFMRSQLDRFGVSAVGMSDTTERALADAAFAVEGSGNEINGKMVEMQQAAQELANTLSEQLVDSFDIFGELPEKVKGIDEVIAKSNQLRDVAVQLGADVQTLLERGVPAGLIEQLMAEGPAMVRQFASASKSELGKLVTNYQVALGAMDAEILKEAAHQEIKGKDMVEGFATAIRTSSNLTKAATVQILTTVANALGNGDLKPQALSLIEGFIDGLGTVEGLSDKEGSKAAQAFVQGLTSGNFVDNAGKLIPKKAARGIAAASGLTYREAFALVNRIAAGMKDNSQAAENAARVIGANAARAFRNQDDSFADAGARLAFQFAAGLRSPGAQAQVESAANRLAGIARTALDDGLKNSPKYFSYYMGIELGKQLAAGFANGSDDPETRRNTRDGVDRLILVLRHALRTSKQLDGLFDELFDNIKEGFKKGLDKADLEMAHDFEEMFKNLDKRLQRLKKRYDNLTSAVRSGFEDFKDLIGNFGDALAEYRDANDQYIQDLQDYQEALEDYYTTLAEGGEAEMPTPPTPPTPVDPNQFLADQLAQAKQLAALLKKLAKMGLAPALIAQLAAQGAAAIPIAEALMAGGQDLIDDFNETYGYLNQVTNNTAELLGEHYFGKAIRHVTNKLDHLANQLERFIDRLVGMLNKAADDLAKALGTLANQAGNAGGGNGNGNGNNNGGNNNNGGGRPGPAGNPNKPPPGGRKVETYAPFDPRNPVPVMMRTDIPQPINVYVTGWVGSDQQIAAKVRDEFLRIERNNGRTGV